MSGQRTRCDGHMSPLALMSGDPSERVTGALWTAISVLPEGGDEARTSGFGRYVSARAIRPFIVPPRPENAVALCATIKRRVLPTDATDRLEIERPEATDRRSHAPRRPCPEHEDIGFSVAGEKEPVRTVRPGDSGASRMTSRSPSGDPDPVATSKGALEARVPGSLPMTRSRPERGRGWQSSPLATFSVATPCRSCCLRRSVRLAGRRATRPGCEPGSAGRNVLICCSRPGGDLVLDL
jgi:hypothetical protein